MRTPEDVASVGGAAGAVTPPTLRGRLPAPPVGRYLVVVPAACPGRSDGTVTECPAPRAGSGAERAALCGPGRGGHRRAGRRARAVAVAVVAEAEAAPPVRDAVQVHDVGGGVRAALLLGHHDDV